MLWELSVAEQRGWAVLEAGAGVPVTEVAEWSGVGCQACTRPWTANPAWPEI